MTAFMTGSQIKTAIFAYLKRRGWTLDTSAVDERNWIDPIDQRRYMFHAAYVVEFSREMQPEKAA